jgi:hypothetical protein
LEKAFLNVQGPGVGKYQNSTSMATFKSVNNYSFSKVEICNDFKRLRENCMNTMTTQAQATTMLLPWMSIQKMQENLQLGRERETWTSQKVSWCLIIPLVSTEFISRGLV